MIMFHSNINFKVITLVPDRNFIFFRNKATSEETSFKYSLFGEAVCHLDELLRAHPEFENYRRLMIEALSING